MWTTILKKLALSAIPTIIEFGKKIFDKLTSAPKMDEKNSADEVAQIGMALADLREHVISQSKPLIADANESLTDYIEEQLFILEEKEKIFSKYKISTRSVERKLQKVERRANDFWKDALYLRISMDDPHCREILMMPSGEMKSQRIAAFTEEILRQTLNEYAELVRNELADIYDDLTDDVEGTLSRLEGTVKDYAAIVQSLEENDDAKFESLIARAKAKVFCYDVMIEKVRD